MNSFKSRLDSREVICLITAGGVMNSSSAALLKLPASATRRKVSSWGLYIMRAAASLPTFQGLFKDYFTVFQWK